MHLRNEYVLKVVDRGQRPRATRTRLPTGDVEVTAQTVEVLSSPRPAVPLMSTRGR